MSASHATPAEVEIRPVRVADVERWLNLRVALWPEQALDVHREEVARLLSGDQQKCCFVAVGLDGAIAGFIEMAIRSAAEGCGTSPVAYIEGIFVVPRARRMGLAQRLLNVAEEWAARRNLLEIAADVAIDNSLGQQLHLGCGFDEVSRRVAYRREVKFTEQRSAPQGVTATATEAVLAAQLAPGAKSVPEAAVPLDYNHLLGAEQNSGRSLSSTFYVVNGILALITVACIAMSSVYSNDIWRGAVLPILSGILILYFVLVALWLNSRRR